jgi:putative cell wall-binding protein
VSADRPINADVEGPEGAPEAPSESIKPAEATPVDAPRPAVAPEALKGATSGPPPEQTPAGPSRAPRPARRRGIPGPIKLVAILVVIAVGFIVLAVVAGTGSKKGSGGSTSTPPPSAAAAPVESPAATTSSESSSSEGEGGESEPSDSAAAEELGYPTFATSNTTRIGGPDPISNAAATALAVFPATSEKQRPVGVTMVGEEDWAGAVAAGVLMAEPIRAPLLFGEAEGVPDATAAALEALQPQGGAATGGDAVLAIGNVEVPEGMNAAKLAAGDAASEAAAIARLRDRLSGGKPDAIVLASSTEPAYAAPAAAYAARSGDPVLFTEAESLPLPTVSQLRRDEGAPVYALGPGSAISGKVLKEVEALGAKVHRISGANPVESAISFARFGDGKFGWHISDPGHGFVMARSDAPLEAAAAAALSASGTWGPLLVTDSADTLPSELRGYFLDVKPGYTNDPTRAFYNHVWIVGDTGQISVQQQAEVNEVAELAKIGTEE